MISTPGTRKLQLGQLLLEYGAVSAEQLQQATDSVEERSFFLAHQVAFAQAIRQRALLCAGAEVGLESRA